MFFQIQITHQSGFVANQFYAKPSHKVRYCNLFPRLQIFFTMAHECEYCGLTFQRLYNMKRHMERRHNRSHEDYDSDIPLTKKPRISDEESVDNDSSTESEYESSTDSEHDSSTDSEHDSTLETSTESSAED